MIEQCPTCGKPIGKTGEKKTEYMREYKRKQRAAIKAGTWQPRPRKKKVKAK